MCLVGRQTLLSHVTHSARVAVADLEGVEPAPPPPPFGRRVRHHSRYSWYVTPSQFLSLQTRKTWYSEYSKRLPPVAIVTALERTKFVFGSAGAYSAPPDLLAGLRKPTSTGEWRKGEGEKGKGRRTGKKGRGGTGPLSQIPGSAPELCRPKTYTVHSVAKNETYFCKQRNSSQGELHYRERLYIFGGIILSD